MMCPKRTHQEDRNQKLDVRVSRCRLWRHILFLRIMRAELEQPLKRYSSSPLTRVRRMLSGVTPPPLRCLRKGTHIEAPSPQRGGGGSFAPIRRKSDGGGVINDSIHIFRQRKIWIPFPPLLQKYLPSKEKTAPTAVFSFGGAGEILTRTIYRNCVETAAQHMV